MVETALPGWALANTVTGFATVFAGLMALALSWLTGGQPRRWMLAVQCGRARP